MAWGLLCLWLPGGGLWSHTLILKTIPVPPLRLGQAVKGIFLLSCCCCCCFFCCVVANAAENEANVRHALDTYPFLELVPAQPLLGGPGLTRPAHPSRFAAVLAEAAAGCADKPKPSVLVAAQEAAAVEQGTCWLSEEEAAMVQRFCPARQLDTIGFFAAKFHKTRSCLGGQ